LGEYRFRDWHKARPRAATTLEPTVFPMKLLGEEGGAMRAFNTWQRRLEAMAIPAPGYTAQMEPIDKPSMGPAASYCKFESLSPHSARFATNT